VDSSFETPIVSNKIRRIGSSPRLSSKSYTVARRALESIDLNERACEADRTPSPPSLKRKIRVRFPATPWELGVDKYNPESAAAAHFYSWVTSCADHGTGLVIIFHSF
jgi:hypothetical protein